MTAAAALEAVDLGKTFRRGPEQVHAVAGASFSLFPGEIVALVGPSGSGKTTLLNLLAGWERPDSGQFRGPSPSGTAPTWGQLAIVPQALGLLDELTIRENVELPLVLAAQEPVDAGSTLELLGLAEFADRLPAEVSLGEQQRAAVARAVVARPRVLVADEPTGHQDATWAVGVFRALRRASEERTACLVATHNEESLKYVDRVLTIRDGVVRAAFSGAS